MYMAGAAVTCDDGEYTVFSKPVVAPLAWLIVRGKHERCRGLVDTGASINLISETVLERFPHRRIRQQPVHLIGVGGGTTRLNEWFNVEVLLPNGNLIEIPMLCGLEEQIGMIFGMPFLEQVHAVIDVDHHMLKTSFGTFGYGEHNNSGRVLQKNDTDRWAMLAVIGREQEMMEEALKETALSDKGIIVARGLMEEYAEIWQPDSLGEAQDYTHTFILAHHRPIVLPPRVIAERFHPEIEKQIQEMLKRT